MGHIREFPEAQHYWCIQLDHVQCLINGNYLRKPKDGPSVVNWIKRTTKKDRRFESQIHRSLCWWTQLTVARVVITPDLMRSRSSMPLFQGHSFGPPPPPLVVSGPKWVRSAPFLHFIREASHKKLRANRYGF